MLSLEATEVVVVDTEEGMTQLIGVLKNCRFISVSVIQHRYRSYLGYSSIIMVGLRWLCDPQISSPTTDFVVDAIKAHSYCWRLNEIFTDPAILKVMFNANEPLLWLQRDFGVFMVNLFDIQMALTVLGEKKRSFGDVLMERMGIYINMRYKRADWRWGRVSGVRSRTRPLTPEMLLYVRQTTHYNFVLMKELVGRLRALSNRHINRVGRVGEA